MSTWRQEMSPRLAQTPMFTWRFSGRKEIQEFWDWRMPSPPPTSLRGTERTTSFFMLRILERFVRCNKHFGFKKFSFHLSYDSKACICCVNVEFRKHIYLWFNGKVPSKSFAWMLIDAWITLQAVRPIFLYREPHSTFCVSDFEYWIVLLYYM